LAQETLAIVGRGHYTLPSGARVELGPQIEEAVSGTRLYTPRDLEALVVPATPAVPRRIEVTPEGTVGAARRLALEAGGPVMALNFASARNPGGGFLSGAKAQEEDLARCSALYTCQLTQRAYYDANRREESKIYTNHLIYSPAVPFFRDERLDLLPAPFLASVITSPAPNAGEEHRRKKNAGPRIRDALRERAGHVLSVAAAHGQRRLVLGAWGCGVFRNDPNEVADAFGQWLEAPLFAGAFDHVVFAILDRSRDKANLRPFQARFPGAAA
jgi:uncharacterized protein (TIGR02452 family)